MIALVAKWHGEGLPEQVEDRWGLDGIQSADMNSLLQAPGVLVIAAMCAHRSVMFPEIIAWNNRFRNGGERQKCRNRRVWSVTLQWNRYAGVSGSTQSRSHRMSATTLRSNSESLSGVSLLVNGFRMCATARLVRPSMSTPRLSRTGSSSR